MNGFLYDIITTTNLLSTQRALMIKGLSHMDMTKSFYDSWTIQTRDGIIDPTK